MSSRGVVQCGVAAVLFGASAPGVAARRRVGGPSDWPGCRTWARRSQCCRRWPSRQALARSRSRLAVAVVLGGAVGPLLLAAGLGYVSAATASLLLNLELVFTTAVAATLFRDHIALRTKRARRT
jgi:drug/metabolite transporter (DMT)-like permease